MLMAQNLTLRVKLHKNADINLTIKSDPLKIKDLINLASEFKLVNKKILQILILKTAL